MGLVVENIMDKVQNYNVLAQKTFLLTPKYFLLASALSRVQWPGMFPIN